MRVPPKTRFVRLPKEAVEPAGPGWVRIGKFRIGKFIVAPREIADR